MRHAPTFFSRKLWTCFTLLMLVLAGACAPIPVTGQAAATPPAAATPAPGATPAPTVTAAPQDPLAQRALVVEFSQATNSSQIVAVDLRSGQPVAGFAPIQIGSQNQTAFSNDRTRLAVASATDGCVGLCLTVIPLASPHQRASVQLNRWADINNYANQLLFDPRDQRLAVTYVDELKDRLAILDVSGPEPRVIQTIDLGASPRLMAFSPDGKQILLIAQAFPAGETSTNTNPTLRALLLDAQTLQTIWQQDLPQVKDGMYGTGDFSKPDENTMYQAGMAEDPAGERVYIAHAGGEQLTTIDFKARAVKTVDIHAPESMLERAFAWLLNLGVTTVQAKAANNYFRDALLSQDGKTLYVVGYDMNMAQQQSNGSTSVSTPFGLEAWDVSSGTKLLHVDTLATAIRRFPGGEILLSGSDLNSSDYHPITEIFDPASGQITARAEDTDAYITLAMNGAPLLVSEYSSTWSNPTLSVLNEKTLKPEVSFKMEASYADWLIYR